MMAFLLVAGVEVGLAIDSPFPSTSAMSWGRPVQAVQLSIAMTNSVFEVPSSTTVAAITTNGATNDIKIDIAFPMVTANMHTTRGWNHDMNLMLAFLSDLAVWQILL